MPDQVPVFVPATGIHTVKAVVDALDLGWLGMGATTQLFERRIGEYLGAVGRPVLATNTGTSALHLALLVAGVQPGDEVIVASFNYVADLQAITAIGAEPVFCDIREDNLGFDVDRVAEMIGPRTKAILPLHFAGIPCDIAGIYELARAHNLRVIEDATHAFGTSINGTKIGAEGDLVCFSFDPVKVITAIDGGAVVCNSAEELDRLQHFRFLGVDKDTAERYKNQRSWEYDVVSQGFRYHLTNINASIGLSQLDRVDGFIASRRQTCREYNAAFRDLDGIAVPQTDFDEVSPFIYFVRVPSDERLTFIDFLRARGVQTGIHFLPAHTFTYYRDRRRGPLPVTEKVASEIVTLPLHSHMPTALSNQVIEAVREFARTRRPVGARSRP